MSDCGRTADGGMLPMVRTSDPADDDHDGVDASRLEIHGMGSSQPIASNAGSGAADQSAGLNRHFEYRWQLPPERKWLVDPLGHGYWR